MQWWCVLESELRAPFYRRSEAVAVNGVLRRWLRRRRAWSGRFRELGVNVEFPWFRFDAKHAWIRSPGWIRRNGAARPRRRQRACPVLAGPRRRCCGGALACMSHAESQGALGGAGWRGELAQALTGRHGWRCHRRSCQLRRCSPPPTPTPVQEGVRCSGQGGEAVRNTPKRTVDRDNSLTKKRH